MLLHPGRRPGISVRIKTHHRLRQWRAMSHLPGGGLHSGLRLPYEVEAGFAASGQRYILKTIAYRGKFSVCFSHMRYNSKKVGASSNSTVRSEEHTSELQSLMRISTA